MGLQSMTSSHVYKFIFHLLCHQVFLYYFACSCSEDTDILRMHTLSETDDIESVKKMVDDSSLEEDKDGSSSMD